MNRTNNKKVTLSVFIMCLLSSAFYCYEYYLRVAPSAMREDLMESFNINNTTFGILSCCYYLSYVPLQIPVGIVMDKYGPRLVLTVACFICSISTFIFASTCTTLTACIGRFFLGLGSAFAYIGVLKIANLWLHPKYFAFTVGVSTSLGMIGALTGEVIISKLKELYGWRDALYSGFIVGLILSLLLCIFIKNNGYFYSNSNNRTYRGMLGDIGKILKIKQLWLNGLIGCLTFLPLSIFAEIWAIPFLEKCGLAKIDAATGSGMVFFGFAFGGPIWGLLSEKIQSRKYPILVGTFISSLISIWILFQTSLNTYFLFVSLFLFGLFGSVQVLVFVISNDMCDSELTATTISFTNSLVMLGGFILQPVIGLMLDLASAANNDINAFTIDDYQKALLYLPIGLIIAFISSIFLKETYFLNRRK